MDKQRFQVGDRVILISDETRLPRGLKGSIVTLHSDFASVRFDPYPYMHAVNFEELTLAADWRGFVARFTRVALALMLLCMPARAESARQLHDVSHAAVGAVVTFAAYGVLKSIGADREAGILGAVALAGALAVAKESTDRSGFSGRDFGFGIGGAALAGSAALAFEF